MTKKSLSRHKLRITTERMSQHIRDCCNKVEELKEEISVATKDRCRDIKQTTSTELCCDKVKLCLDKITEDSMKICRDKKLKATKNFERQRL